MNCRICGGIAQVTGLCRTHYAREWYRDNKQKVKARYDDTARAKKREYYLTNRQRRLEQMRTVSARFYQANKTKINTACIARNRDKYRTDVVFKLRACIRERMKSALRGAYQAGIGIQLLGCTIAELRDHLETKFQDGMTWENYGLHGWHIDHRRPLSSFDLRDPEQLRMACHFTNLQPLWAEQNWNKGKKHVD